MIPVSTEISVVVPVYNGEKTIKSCLDSLLYQDIPASRFHIIVVNNASKDNTQKILDEYEDRISVVYEEERGPAAARNCGIDFCTSSVVAFIDADCVADPGWLRHLSQQFENQEIGIVGGQILAISPDNPVQKFGERIHDHRNAIEGCKPPYFISMNLAIRHDILDQVGLFESRYRRGEDVDLAWRLIEAGYNFYYSPDSIIYHQNESSIPGLFREGFQHGLYGVQLLKHHEVFLYKMSGKRNTINRLQRVSGNLKKILYGDDSKMNYYETVFNSGKLFGSALGSICYRYFQI